jgi:hypothetical protein
MRRLYWFLLVLVVAFSVSMGQVYKYVYDTPFPPQDSGRTTLGGIINVGIGVDPAGKVWVQTRSENSTRDSIVKSDGTGKARLFPIYVFNPNGTQASFSPIKILTGPDQNNVTVTDTLIRSGSTGGNINRKNGNFAATWGSLSYKPGPLIWEIDHVTGLGVRRILLALNTLQNNIASLALNQDGEYYLASVLGGSPGLILNPDGTSGPQFASSVADIGRAIAVSANGNDVYIPRFTSYKTFVYHSATGSSGTYAKTDSIFLGASIECIAIHPTTGYVWAVPDRRSGMDTVSTVKRRWTWNNAYAYNPTTKTIVDSFAVAPPWINIESSGVLPRGIAFSPTGDTIYFGHFDVSTIPAVHRFRRVLTSVEPVNEPTIPTGYVLEQNFPNPFNPTTEIHFKISNPGMTTLKVYDLLGREVASLVDNYLAAGSYKARFEAVSLTSGTYIYVLTSGETRISKKMLLMK